MTYAYDSTGVRPDVWAVGCPASDRPLVLGGLPHRYPVAHTRDTQRHVYAWHVPYVPASHGVGDHAYRYPAMPWPSPALPHDQVTAWSRYLTRT
jgi:hypothetical protein